MKTSHLLLSLSILFGSVEANPAWAGDADARVSRWVEAALLEPLARREAARSRYSRVRLPPAARQVRVLDGAPERDQGGRTFVRFAIDEQRPAGWERNALAGCAYLDDGAVFVQRGQRVQSAAQYLGQDGPRATTECTAAALASKR